VPETPPRTPAILLVVAPVDTNRVLIVSCSCQRPLRVIHCSGNAALLLVPESPPCIVLLIALESPPLIVHLSFGRVLCSKSIVCCLFGQGLGSVVDAGDNSVRSWFHLGDSSMVGGGVVAVVALAGESSAHSWL
jgi:hypothetical protein